MCRSVEDTEVISPCSSQGILSLQSGCWGFAQASLPSESLGPEPGPSAQSSPLSRASSRGAEKHGGQVAVGTQRHGASPQVLRQPGRWGGKWFGSQPWAREAGRVQPPESPRGGPGRGCSAQRQIAVIRKFKRLGEGLRAQALPQIRMGPPNPGPHLGLRRTFPHLTALCLRFSLGLSGFLPLPL